MVFRENRNDTKIEAAFKQQTSKRYELIGPRNIYKYSLRSGYIASEAPTYISTRSTLIPHVSVASSKETWHSGFLFQTSVYVFTCARVACVLSFNSKLIPDYLHVPGDGFALAEDLVKRPGSHRVPKRCLRQQFGAVMSVLDVRDRNRRVVHSIVHHRVNRHRHAVLRQHLMKIIK